MLSEKSIKDARREVTPHKSFEPTRMEVRNIWYWKAGDRLNVSSWLNADLFGLLQTRPLCPRNQISFAPTPGSGVRGPKHNRCRRWPTVQLRARGGFAFLGFEIRHFLFLSLVSSPPRPPLDCPSPLHRKIPVVAVLPRRPGRAPSGRINHHILRRTALGDIGGQALLVPAIPSLRVAWHDPLDRPGRLGRRRKPGRKLLCHQ